MKPCRVQLRRVKGWKMPPNTVKVARPTRWGNPFVVGVDGDASACVESYRMMIENNRDYQLEVQRVLRGKNLACWCEKSPCHAEILIEWANK